MRERLETPFAIFTLFVTLPYLAAETYHYVRYVGVGNGVLGYAVDLIAMALLLLGSIASLRNRSRSAAGWLAAAWGFTACLNYRAFAWRYEANAAEETVAEPSSVLTILAVTLAFSFVALFVSLYLARPKTSD
jgi:hypothetical protein